MAPRRPVNAREATRVSISTPRTNTVNATRTISVAGIFKKRPVKAKASQKHLPQHRTIVATSRSRKKNHQSRKDSEHPLTLDFADSASSYRSDLLEEATIALNNTHAKLLRRLNDEGGEGQDAQAGSLSNIATMAAALKESVKQAAISISKEMFHVKCRTQEFKGDVTIEVSLGDRMTTFAEIVWREQQRMDKYQIEYDSVMKDIEQLSVEMGYGGDVSTAEKGSLSYAAIQSALNQQVKLLECEVDSIGKDVLAKLEKQRRKEVMMKKELAQFLESKFAEYDDL